MTPELANVVDRVLLCGLDLKDRLAKGEPLDFAVERHQLRQLLKSDSEARRWPDYAGDGVTGGTMLGGQRTTGFQGIRFALVCWLDDIFISDSPWSAQWKEQTFEFEMYRTRERAEVFWEQAQRAEARPNTDALEAYYLCAILGFRGQYVTRPEKVREWCDRVEPRITREFDRGYDLPAARVPPCNVPPLTGRGKLRRLIVGGAALAALLLILLGFVIVWWLNP
jgi:type VI secretion system protein ImpK